MLTLEGIGWQLDEGEEILQDVSLVIPDGENDSGDRTERRRKDFSGENYCRSVCADKREAVSGRRRYHGLEYDGKSKAWHQLCVSAAGSF